MQARGTHQLFIFFSPYSVRLYLIATHTWRFTGRVIYFPTSCFRRCTCCAGKCRSRKSAHCYLKQFEYHSERSSCARERAHLPKIKFYITIRCAHCGMAVTVCVESALTVRPVKPRRIFPRDFSTIVLVYLVPLSRSQVSAGDKARFCRSVCESLPKSLPRRARIKRFRLSTRSSTTIATKIISRSHEL